MKTALELISLDSTFIMKSVTITTILCCFTALAQSSTPNDTPGDARDFEWLKARVQQLENKEQELEGENQVLMDMLRMMQSKQDAAAGVEVFDCFRSESWAQEGLITYDGCSVDTTAGNPASGNFVVGEQGIYRKADTQQRRFLELTAF